MIVNHCQTSLWYDSNGGDSGKLVPGQRVCHDLGGVTAAVPAVRYWAFSGEDPGAGKHSLAVLELNTGFQGLDFYDISYVDAHNLPLEIAPMGRPSCRRLTCSDDLLPGCPVVGQVKDKDGRVVSCTNPDKQNPASPVAQYFDTGCSDAYAYTSDDAEALTACDGEDYEVAFCPPAAAND